MSNEDVWARLANKWSEENDFTRKPVEWIDRKAHEFCWSQQRAILESLVTHRYTAVHSAHDMGKSFIASRAMGWWNDVHPSGESFVVSTAPTAAQVSAILWRELTKLHTKADLPGRINRAGYPQWFIDNQLTGYGRKPGDYDESAFQGIHERYVLIVIDEAGGVAKHLFDSVDALATNEHARVLAIGNPDDPGSHFSSLCKPDSDWNVIHLDGLRSPNMNKEQVIGRKSEGWGYENPRYPLTWALMRATNIPFSTEVIPPGIDEMLISPLWIEERIRRWAGLSKTAFFDYAPDELETIVLRRCEQSPLFTAKVRGLFPTAGTAGVIPLGWIQRAVERWHDIFDIPDDMRQAPSLAAVDPSNKVLGVDVAGEGADETVVAIRYGNIVKSLERMRMADTMETVDFVAPHMDEPHVMAVIDSNGIGAGVYDRLAQMKREGLIQGTPVPFTAQSRSDRHDVIGEHGFRNDRAAAWWNMRELLDPSRGSTVALPDDERLIEELCTVKYEHLVGNKIKIESKDEIRKRLGRSTDSADAVIQSFWVLARHMNLDPIAWGAVRGNVGVVRYTDYSGFTEDDMSVTPGVAGKGNKIYRMHNPYQDEDLWGSF